MAARWTPTAVATAPGTSWRAIRVVGPARRHLAFALPVSRPITSPPQGRIAVPGASRRTARATAPSATHAAGLTGAVQVSAILRRAVPSAAVPAASPPATSAARRPRIAAVPAVVSSSRAIRAVGAVHRPLVSASRVYQPVTSPRPVRPAVPAVSTNRPASAMALLATRAPERVLAAPASATLHLLLPAGPVLTACPRATSGARPTRTAARRAVAPRRTAPLSDRRPTGRVGPEPPQLATYRALVG